MNVTTITRFVQICSMHVYRHCVATSYTVLLSGKVLFLLLVSAMLLVTQEVEKKLSELMIGYLEMDSGPKI